MESKSDQMCEIRLTKLPYVAQRVGIVHFYAATEINGVVMSPVMNGRVEKFAHFNTRGSLALSSGHPQVTSHKNLGSKVRARLTDFRELTARDNGIQLYSQIIDITGRSYIRQMIRQNLCRVKHCFIHI